MHSPFCCVDENLIQTSAALGFPHHVANRSVMSVEWGRATAHPETYESDSVTLELLRGLRQEMVDRKHKNLKNPNERPCSHNGKQAFCWLFARKFAPSSIEKLLSLANITRIF